MKSVKIIFIAFIFLTLTVVPSSAAQKLGGDSKQPIVCNGDVVEYFEAEKKVVGTGNVIITYEDVKLTCDKAVIYIDTKDAYCDGGVVFYQAEGVFSGDRFVYNFGTKKGHIVNSSGITPPVYEKAEETDKVAEKELTMRNGYVTTCELDKPHYRIQSKSMNVFLGDKVVAKNAVFFLGDHPIMWFPKYNYSLLDDRPHVSIIPGYGKDWGMYVLTKTRFEIDKNAKGYILMDEREKRDFASGIDYIYKTKKYGKGKLRLYYMDERRLESHLYSNPRILEREWERFRVQLRHKWQIDKNTLGILEYHKMRDPDFIKDYFYKEEYEKLSQPESYISVISMQPYYTLSFLEKKRMNKFETVTEEAPKITLDMKAYQIGNSSLYYKSDATYDALNTKAALAASEDIAESKLSTYNQISYATNFPWVLNWINFTPYVATRQVLHSRDTTGVDRNIIQGAYYGGWDITTKFYRLFGIKKKILSVEINGLRHVITPTWHYSYVHRPSAPDSKFSFGEIAPVNVYTFSLENKFQTKWMRDVKKDIADKEKEGMAPEEVSKYLKKLTNVDRIDLIRHQLSVNYLPHTEDRHLSTVTSNLEIEPKRWFFITNDITYNPYTRDFESVAIDAKVRKPGNESLGRDLEGVIRDKWTLGFGHRYLQNDHTQETLEAGYQFNPKWYINVYERFDFKKFVETSKKINLLEEQQYVLSRDLHCWVGEFTYSVRRGYGASVWIIFRLKAYPDLPVEFQRSYNERKLGSQSGV